ncbi:hypothetical protein J6590_081975 [Homalodisca vitripennis]|nr:hypothetical protein J6590_081975 [Homalodisca vitripennis]
MEEQKITELLTGEAELLDQGIVGIKALNLSCINFQKIIPKTDFIKESSVFKELQEQRIKKEEPEEEQLKKDPTKRFSTFLQTPKRPIPKPKPKLTPVEDLPWKKRIESPLPETPVQPQPQPPQPLPPQNIQEQSIHHEETVQSSTTTWSESVHIVEELTTQDSREERVNDENLLRVSDEDGPIITEAVSTESVFDEKVRFQEGSEDKKEDSVEEETKENVTREEQESTKETEYKSEFERQLAVIQKQIESIQELPNMLQANLQALQEQLNKIVEAKESADKKEVEEALEHKRGSNSHLQWKIDVTVEEKTEENAEEDVQEEKTETVDEVIEETNICESTELEETNVLPNGYDENCKNMGKQRQREDDEGSVCKPPMIRNFPRTVAERPIVLPGGRKWYKPRDAYNEDFIAETIINQSEVLVGSTIGLKRDAYNEDFIKEIIINQSEVLVGSTIGLKRDAYNEDFIKEIIINQSEVLVGSTIGLRDAYNEDFIKEIIINQSEVLVGSTIGLKRDAYNEDFIKEIIINQSEVLVGSTIGLRDAYNEDLIEETIINQSEVLVGSTIGGSFKGRKA